MNAFKSMTSGDKISVGVAVILVAAILIAAVAEERKGRKKPSSQQDQACWFLKMVEKHSLLKARL